MDYKAMLSKRRKWLIALGITLVVISVALYGLLALSFAGNATWGNSPSGSCIADDQQVAENTGDFKIPTAAHNITISSEIHASGSCYLVVRFSLPATELDNFLLSTSIQMLATTYPSSHFWQGASLVNWPLVEGNQYLSGAGNFEDVVYDAGVVYFVASLAL